MNTPDVEDPATADLAAAEYALPEWDRLRVRDYWDAVVAEELGARPPSNSFARSELSSGERVRLRRYQRRAGNTVLRLVTAVADASAFELDGEAA